MSEEELEEIRRRCDWWCDQIQKADDEAIDRGEAHGNYGETWAEAVSYCGSLLTHVYNLRTKLSCKTFCCETHQEERERDKKDENRPFRIMGDSPKQQPSAVPWWLAEIAYKGYRYDQSLERIHERGGFSRKELVALIRDEYDKL